MTSSIVGAPDIDASRIGSTLKPLAAGVLIVSSALTAYGAHDLREIIVVITVIVAVTAAVYGFLLPRKLTQESAGGTALTLAVLAALLLLPAFWSGLPLVLGAAGAVLGYAGRNASTGSRQSMAALVLGVLASIGYFAVYLLDTLAQLGVGWA